MSVGTRGESLGHPLENLESTRASLVPRLSLSRKRTLIFVLSVFLRGFKGCHTHMCGGEPGDEAMPGLHMIVGSKQEAMD
jgi:hypothetical protein